METVGEMASNKERLNYAFDRAEKYLNIPRLNVEGMKKGCTQFEIRRANYKKYVHIL